ncbi:unnamed protein product [Ambrosiozyma monospora]|uniref:Unnamed protein product n=1 Tax=Ambrosiozyma monospora TaxID=43982 RepID=A0A9W6SXU5_AMBMO|nr:unnamed protein product [Ambrosiozyma monospora]
MYAEYAAVKLKDLEKANTIYRSLISSNPSLTEPVGKYFCFLMKHKDQELVIAQSLACDNTFIAGYSTKSEGGEPPKKKKKNPTGGPKPAITDSDFKALYPKLTYNNVTQFIVEIAKHYWLTEHKVKKTRELLVLFYKQEIVKCSSSYWSFFFKFEISQRNKTNVMNIVNYLKYQGQLPTSIINNFIFIYTDFLMKNSSSGDLKKINREVTRCYLEVDQESSTHMKHFLKARLDPQLMEESTNNILIKEAGHPCAIREGRPRITNAIDFTTRLDEQETPAHPVFTNVEKANAPVRYIYESI